MKFNFQQTKGIGIENLQIKDKLFVDLLIKLLQYDPNNWISAGEALNHPYFDSIKTIKYIIIHNKTDERQKKQTFIRSII